MEFFHLGLAQSIVLPEQAKNPAISDLLHNYAYGVTWNIQYHEDVTSIILGNGSFAPLEGYEYVIHATPDGIFVGGGDYNATIRGFVTLLEMIFCYGKNDYRVKCTLLRESPKIPFRSVHLCLFPEYTLDVLRKTIRTCGIAKYTHLILEPWGSIQLDTLKELAWPNAHSKEEIRELVAEAHALGMEVIPFFQHLGHASLARLSYTGKHTLLDQNPALEYLYDPESYGWVWNFKSAEVREMLQNVREELCDLFADCHYFHLGCDESGLEFDADELCSYLNEVNAHLNSLGKRAIIWSDMLLSHAFFPDEPKYVCNSSEEYANALLEKLDRNILLADWQYYVENHAWESSQFLCNRGFDVLCCPWDENENLNGALDTVTNGGYFGLLKTTWDRLFDNRGIPSIVYGGLNAYGDRSMERFHKHIGAVVERAHFIFRKCAPRVTTYENSGWRKHNVTF